MLESFGSAFQYKAENGLNVARLAPIVHSQSLRGLPVPTKKLDPTNWSNPYPQPGQAGNPHPFTGTYPHVKRAPK
jgi:hypothetical protein